MINDLDYIFDEPLLMDQLTINGQIVLGLFDREQTVQASDDGFSGVVIDKFVARIKSSDAKKVAIGDNLVFDNQQFIVEIINRHNGISELILNEI